MDSEKTSSFLKPEEKEFQVFYKRSIWWIGHRAILKKIGLLILFVFALSLFISSGWFLLDAFVISYDREQLAIAKLAAVGQTELHSFSDQVAAKPLGLGGVTVLTSKSEVYDFATTVANYNEDWYATFDYKFVTESGETGTTAGFILPNEERPLIFLSFNSSTRPAAVSVELSNVKWQRVDGHLINDYQEWSNDRLALQIENSVFTKTGNGISNESAQLSFDVTNTSAFGLRAPSFIVFLRRGETIVGVMRLATSILESKETKHMSARWLGVVPAVSKIDIWPQVNLFDQTIYLLPAGATSLDKK